MVQKPKTKSLNIAFFGTPDRAVYVLDELKKTNLRPSLIVTQPDRPQGRKLIVTPPPAKAWGLKERIEILQPEDPSAPEFLKTLKSLNFDVFVVVAYGKILTKELLSIPKHGSLNLHASLLPLLRGSCPIETAILKDMKETGVSIILMDEKMDHGPLIAQREVPVSTWPLPADELAKVLVHEGGKLFTEILPKWVAGKIQATEQDHSKATYTKKIVKEDGEINLSDDGYKNFLKWNAYKGWPGSFFWKKVNGRNIRIIITEASYKDGVFSPVKVIPEGKKEIEWSAFEKNNL